jgi:hypothetical protein
MTPGLGTIRTWTSSPSSFWLVSPLTIVSEAQRAQDMMEHLLRTAPPLDVQALQREVERGPGTNDRLDHAVGSLSRLTRQVAMVRDSVLRQEFQLPLQAYATQYVVAVYTGYSDCGAVKQRWQTFVNNTAIPFLNKPRNGAMKMAVQRDDPDYHATLLNALPLSC